MKKNVIAVCDTEGEYACNFAEYLNSRKKLPFQAEAFTDVEKLCTYAGKNPPEILLITLKRGVQFEEDKNCMYTGAGQPQ